jgi:hypothetical protein
LYTREEMLVVETTSNLPLQQLFPLRSPPFSVAVDVTASSLLYFGVELVLRLRCFEEERHGGIGMEVEEEGGEGGKKGEGGSDINEFVVASSSVLVTVVGVCIVLGEVVEVETGDEAGEAREREDRGVKKMGLELSDGGGLRSEILSDAKSCRKTRRRLTSNRMGRESSLNTLLTSERLAIPLPYAPDQHPSATFTSCSPSSFTAAAVKGARTIARSSSKLVSCCLTSRTTFLISSTGSLPK